MSESAEYVIRREARDWVALEVHRWERTRRGPFGWILFGLAWLLAAYMMLSASMISVMWLNDMRRGRTPPLNVAETGVVILAIVTFTGLVVGPTIPPVRRAFALQRTRLRVRQLVQAGKLRPGVDTRVRLDDIGWTEFGDGPDAEPRTVPWAAVQGIDQTDESLFVAVAGGPWIVVPARAFADRPAFLAFTARVRDMALAVRAGDVRAGGPPP